MARNLLYPESEDGKMAKGTKTFYANDAAADERQAAQQTLHEMLGTVDRFRREMKDWFHYKAKSEPEFTIEEFESVMAEHLQSLQQYKAEIRRKVIETTPQAPIRPKLRPKLQATLRAERPGKPGS